jgi:uncharacterized membrane protein
MSESKDLEKNHQNNHLEPKARLIATATYQGPLPDPMAFNAYNQILPGSADRILKMAEKAQDAEVEGMRAAISHEKRIHTTLRWIVLPSLTGGFVLAAVNNNPISYAILIGELASLVYAFFRSQKPATTPSASSQSVPPASP